MLSKVNRYENDRAVDHRFFYSTSINIELSSVPSWIGMIFLGKYSSFVLPIQFNSALGILCLLNIVVDK